MSSEPDAASFDKSRAELFDALGHPVRIRILNALGEGPLGFTELKRRVGLESGGHLQFHLGKLDGLVRALPDGSYGLTEEGTEALRLLSQASGSGVAPALPRRKSPMSPRIMAVVLIGVVILSAAAIVLFSGYETQQRAQASLIGNLEEEVGSLSANYSAVRDMLDEYDSLLHSNATYYNSTLGLSLGMNVSTVVLKRGQSISINIAEFNMRQGFNNISAAENWAYTGYQEGLCVPGIGLMNLPFNVAILRGYYYNATQLAGLSSLQIYYSPCFGPIFSCAYLGGPPSEYDFYPSSGRAAIWNGTGFAGRAIDGNVSTSLTLTGYYPSLCALSIPAPTPSDFELGVYTVVGGDEWGQLIFLHFIVVP
jgi:DNA-binding transcriptional ArsR family regulator